MRNISSEILNLVQEKMFKDISKLEQKRLYLAIMRNNSVKLF